MKTLNVPLVAGRDFTEAEGRAAPAPRSSTPRFAKRMWPKRTIRGAALPPARRQQNQWITVVGVIGDFQLFSVRNDKPVPYAFVSYPYDPARNTGLTVRVAAAPRRR
jgi:hypothetical protein